MELSGIELRYLVNEIKKKICTGYYVSNVYGITKDSIQLKLHHPTDPDILLMISDKGIWISKLKFEQIDPGGLVSTLRDQIVRAKVEDVQQIGTERIVMLTFSAAAEKRNLIAEFFAGGNIILTSESMKILALLKTIDVRHRVLRVGTEYKFPPRRGMDALEVTYDDIRKIRSSDLAVARWIGRNIALPKKYVEAVVRESSLDPETTGKELEDTDVNTLFEKLTSIVSDVCNGNHNPVIMMESGEPVDASPVVLDGMDNYEQVDSYMDAVDTVLSNQLRRKGESIRSSEYESKVVELERALGEQEKARESLLEKSSSIRNFADQLMALTYRGTTNLADTSVSDLIENSDASLVEEYGQQMLVIKNEKIPVNTKKIPSVVSAIYDRAKELERGLESIDNAKKKLIAELEEARKQSAVAKQEISITEQESKEWYERYRWFFTTNGLLAVGGRDASSNSALIRKHLDDNDLVFHAEIHGSPFFILKGADAADEESITQVAHATASFSRAWKEGIASVDAFWVKPEQVKKGAPSGQFLAKGSFIIEGKKNYVKNLALELAVGLSKINDMLKVICGPPDSIKKNSLVYVRIVPDGYSSADAAKKIKSEFVKKVGNTLSDYVKKLSLDEIIRSLPSGGCGVATASTGDRERFQQND